MHAILWAALVPSLSFGQTLFGVGLSASSLGLGVQGAVSVTNKSDVRGGFNAFDYTDNFTKDGIDYSGTLRFRSAEVMYDQFIVSGFHVSPGLLIYNGNQGSANASVPASQAFSLGGTTYYSGATNPVSGNGTVTFNKVAPMILLGFGNLLPRGQRHFGLSFDVGVVFQGAPSAKLNLGGTTCLTSQQSVCVSTASDPVVQSGVQAEQTKLNGDLNPFKFYPVVLLTFSYKF